jgi:hypothetical protein
MVDLFNIDAKSSFWGVAGVGSFVDGAAAVFGADTHLTQATHTHRPAQDTDTQSWFAPRPRLHKVTSEWNNQHPIFLHTADWT